LAGLWLRDALAVQDEIEQHPEKPPEHWWAIIDLLSRRTSLSSGQSPPSLQ
jgi:hypothetical protein